MQRAEDALWNGEAGAGGISWVDRSRMGPLRGVIDAADATGRRNAYMHQLHTMVLRRELERISPVERALDFGCGTGRMLETLHAHSAHTYAVDREPAMARAACGYAGRFAVRIDCWDGSDLAFEAGFFDFVLCSSVLCVTSARLFDRSLFAIARVMRRGGTLLLFEQIAPARDLTLRRYFCALANAGFEPVRAYAIRSGRSIFTNWITAHGGIPQWSFGAFAALELAFAKRDTRTARADPYVEYAIAARRR
ncbi:MAG TPA: class I SAM-dependent methyltransferase [Candidatus Baltobacteraceae bacterium]|nr:class I SAM-dependent methyltransferase [Candidatus Baltobacteraceae bacterium]